MGTWAVNVPDRHPAPHRGHRGQLGPADRRAALVIGLQGCRTFPEAAQAAEVFLNPLLDGSVHGNWDPSKGAWQ
ncbi:hypothetical protein [Streptomyces sp. MK5]|uniref:hypothetical protein n=1 Tax=Streptomyces sp. MK5 TaxID=3064253 RepID=UPI00274224E2|nr:hypothetical protein [Streptomyces sp. MK5]